MMYAARQHRENEVAQTWTIRGFAAEQFETAQEVEESVRRVLHLTTESITVQRVTDGWLVTVA
jgi:hypothetical protein